MAGAVARLFSADFGRSGSVNQTAGFDPRAIVPGRAGGARKRTIGPVPPSANGIRLKDRAAVARLAILGWVPIARNEVVTSSD
jgi:hypothetical protein